MKKTCNEDFPVQPAVPYTATSSVLASSNALRNLDADAISASTEVKTIFREGYQQLPYGTSGFRHLDEYSEELESMYWRC